jgi:osmotically-inducible protein OsmY
MSKTPTFLELVQEELAWEPSVSAESITAGTAGGGVVTLTGTVRTFAEKVAAERAVRRVRGVLGVVNDLDVKLLMTHRHPDTEIAKAAVNALQWNSVVPRDAIRVQVSDGWVRLEGAVDAQFQRVAAEEAVRTLVGVLGVSNRVTLRPPAQIPQVRAKIEAALQRRASLDAAKVQVRTRDDHTVVLSGSVSSWLERELVEAAAWAAPGVIAVEDEIKVAG